MQPDSAPKLKAIAFTTQVAKANPAHDPEGALDGTKLEIAFNFLKQEPDFRVSAYLRTVDAESINLPYTMEFEAIAVFDLQSIPEPMTPETASVITSVAAGALRQRVAEVTSQGPFAKFMIPMLLLTPTSIAANKRPTDTPTEPSVKRSRKRLAK